ncbi:hypothetical protein LX14_000403 [Williamsia deligens]|nr:hypothetical protein [Williamsia deligens]
MTWTRHTDRVQSRHAVLGMVGLIIGGGIGYFAASDRVWPPVAFAVFLATSTLPLFTAAVLRLEVDEAAVHVRRQPVFRNPAVFFGAGVVAAGLVLVVAYANARSIVWLSVGGAISVLGVLLGAWAWRVQPFRITNDAVIFPKELTFPFATLTASIDYGVRSDDMVRLAANRTLLGGPKRYLALRAYGIHPNTALSTIKQIQAWKHHGVSVSLRTVAAMLSIPDQPDVAVKDSVEFVLPAGAALRRVSGPCSGPDPTTSRTP